MTRPPRASGEVRHLYDEPYFLDQAFGGHQFAAFDGRAATLFARARRNLELLRLEEGEHLLEIGCGRGEVAIAAAVLGCTVEAIDFSEAALQLARAKANAVARDRRQVLQLAFHCGPATEIPLPAGRFDAALIAEFIEHVSRKEGHQILEAICSALKPGGRLLVYTYPNTLQRRFGYPLYRMMVAAAHRKWLPRLQEDMTNEHYRSYHLNEQSYLSLSAALREAGFRTEIWYDMEPLWSSAELSWRQRLLWRTPLVHLFGTDIVALAVKQ